MPQLLDAQVFSMLEAKLRQNQAADAEDAERVALRIGPLLDVVTVDVPKRLREADAERPPSFPLASLFAEAELSVIRKDRSEETLPNQSLIVPALWIATPLAYAVFNEDRRLACYLLPFLILHMAFYMLPQVGVERSLIYRIVARACKIKVEAASIMPVASRSPVIKASRNALSGVPPPNTPNV